LRLVEINGIRDSSGYSNQVFEQVWFVGRGFPVAHFIPNWRNHFLEESDGMSAPNFVGHCQGFKIHLFRELSLPENERKKDGRPGKGKPS